MKQTKQTHSKTHTHTHTRTHTYIVLLVDREADRLLLHIYMHEHTVSLFTAPFAPVLPRGRRVEAHGCNAADISVAVHAAHPLLRERTRERRRNHAWFEVGWFGLVRFDLLCVCLCCLCVVLYSCCDVFGSY